MKIINYYVIWVAISLSMIGCAVRKIYAHDITWRMYHTPMECLNTELRSTPSRAIDPLSWHVCSKVRETDPFE